MAAPLEFLPDAASHPHSCWDSDLQHMLHDQLNGVDKAEYGAKIMLVHLDCCMQQLMHDARMVELDSAQR